MTLNELIKEVETRKDKTQKVQIETSKPSRMLKKIERKKGIDFFNEHFEIIYIK